MFYFVKFQIQEQAYRAARISMDIEAGAPILLFPHSSHSKDILVMDLGKLTVVNTFLLAGLPGTVSAQAATADTQRGSRTNSMSSDITIGANQTGILDDASTIDTSTMMSLSESDRQTTTSGSYKTAVESPTILLEQNSMTSSVYGSFDSDWRSSELESMHSFGSFELAMDATSPTCSIDSDFTLGSDTTLVGSAGGYDTAPTPSSLSSYYTTMGSSSPTSSFLGLPLAGTPVDLSASQPGGASDSTGLPSPSDVFASPTIPVRPTSLSGTNPALTAWQTKWYSEDSASIGSPLYRCLLDIMKIELTEMDLFSAEWAGVVEYKKPSPSHNLDLEFASYVVVRKVSVRILSCLRTWLSER